MVEIMGFVGSALIITSLAMRSMGWLRLVGLAGAVTFIMYGLSLGAWPVVATNTATATLHIYHLWFAGRDGPATDRSLERPGSLGAK